ncbi:hypothetical protein C6P40_003268 [Pichia californica]|uniref:Uncharacterized protein n=1 Tax=Pichia californica TaxID=460514 RepID=A0A9P6WGT3_9ASCO|nr:hypothetical protein C6P42_002825 [[Candida] californica]KAG0686856.1 hypothetical protein C6P40_003268 [[Candida] californica]
MQAESQLKLLIRTTKSKLEFKLSKSRSLSTHTIQTVIVPDLRNLVSMSNDSRSFERSFEILKMKLSQLVRNDRSADVWEDLIGELSILENSINKLITMAELQRSLIAKEQRQQQQNIRSASTNGNGWSFLGFQFNDNKKTQPFSLESSDEEIKENEPLDRVTKVVRNVIVAEDYLSDDIKELHKLALALSKCIDKEKVITRSPSSTEKKIQINDELNEVDLESEEPGDLNDDPTDGKKKSLLNKKTNSPNLDLEDRIYIEIVRKLRGDDEETVVDDYLTELCDIYRIDIYNDGKYKDDVNENDSDGTESPPNNGDLKPQIKKRLDDLDDLKQRFEALKKS